MNDPLRIELRGLRVHAHHGVYPEEQEKGQPFLIDVTIVPQSARACENDRLADAVNYGAIARCVVDTATQRRYDLIERLAAVIGDTLLARFPVERAIVTVHKPNAPLRLTFEDVAVTVQRVRVAAT